MGHSFGMMDRDIVVIGRMAGYMDMVLKYILVVTSMLGSGKNTVHMEKE